ncbi:MAG TPA: FecR domain-containing protein [Candidatus Ozemobacteraceae bacterium]
MQIQRTRRRTSMWGVLFGLSMLGCLSANTAFGAVLSDLSVKEIDARNLCLFAGHEVGDISARQVSPDVLELDLPDYSFAGGPRIAVAPHPKVKFLRVSQASRQPAVVRVAAVFADGYSFEPRVEDGRLILSQVGEQKQEAGAATPVRMNTEVAQEPLPKAAPVRSGVSDVLDQRVSLQFEQQELSTILDALAQKFGLRVFADAGVKGKFTVHATDMPLREVLKSLLLQKNFQYTLRGKDLTVISLGQHADRVARELLFKDLSLKDALQTLSRMMNVNLIIHESVQDKNVNFYVENLSLDELLELLISTNDLVKKPHNENTFVIMTREEARKYGKKQYRTFKLVNAKPSEVISMITGSKSLAEKIDTANMAINERINALSVYETPENLDLIARVIENIDEKLKQAVIEVKLLEVNRSATRDLGIDINRGAGVEVQVADITRIPTSYAIGAKLVMLEKQGKAKVLSSPKIRAVHGKEATINIGQKIPVPYYRYEVASTTYLGYVPQTYKEYRDLDTGIELNVTPEISHDNEISLDINLRVDEVIKINDDGQPTRNSRSSHSYIRVKDGETVVLGGLISSQDTTDTDSPALINKIPLLKRLTSKTKNVKSDVEMIMLVTPRLVNLDLPEDQAGEPSELVIQTKQ